ncbi:MAG TPA: isoprenylcysteine carboxylmethyltransferase family protein [Patescibacteria group bacterium]|nr:isoprenylcysteine carboxylmethyltransferase family protein [Patescibacteria group bacterium]
MVIFYSLIGLIWLIYLLYWYVFSPRPKSSVHNYNWRKEAAIRIAFVILVIASIRIPALNHYFRSVYFQTAYFNPIIDSVGVLLCAAGITFAIWARAHLGRNWGMPRTLREKPELVTTGPYAYVRHPIYSGFILAAIGTALVNELFLLVFVYAVIYFLYSARIEEHDMLQLFPKEYPEYLRRTKALIPFIY